MNFDDVAAKPTYLSMGYLVLLQVKNSFAIIVNGMSVFKLFQLMNGDLLFS